MIYSQTYDINRLMHIRPYAEVVQKVNSLWELYGRIKFKLENAELGYSVTEEDIGLLTCMTFLELKKCGKVKITLEGELSEEILKQETDAIGQVFSRIDNESSAGEVLSGGKSVK